VLLGLRQPGRRRRPGAPRRQELASIELLLPRREAGLERLQGRPRRGEVVDEVADDDLDAAGLAIAIDGAAIVTPTIEATTAASTRPPAPRAWRGQKTGCRRAYTGSSRYHNHRGPGHCSRARALPACAPRV
jgi:hypothetical protein